MDDDDLTVELELDSEWARVRTMRERAFMAAGIDEFSSYRLALVPELDWHRIVRLKQAGASDQSLLDIFLD